MDGPIIRDVTDTARWMAIYRAWESARPDALFHDPFAERLAGERGRAIAAAAPRKARGGWPWVVRARLVDDLIAASLAEGCDRVLNLAAGFDARPYRLDLPRSLQWFEADLPELIAEKDKLLAGEEPRCKLQREAVDLGDANARAAFLDRALAGARKALVITEGLLGYLDEAAARGLCSDLSARPALGFWIQDLSSPALSRSMRKELGNLCAGAPLRFVLTDEGVGYFERFGWVARDIRSVVRESLRFRRVPLLLQWLRFLREPDPRKLGGSRWYAVVRFARDERGAPAPLS